MHKTNEQRALHAQILDQKPGFVDLPGSLRDVAKACATDEDDPACRRARDNLPAAVWERVRAAIAEERRRAQDRAEWYALCRRGDELALRSRYPGAASFYDMVDSPPAFEERPMDAVVVIEIGAGSLVRRAKALLDSGMAREGLKVQYGGSPNKYASRSNTENFFMGYYTPEIEARITTPRPDCDRMRSSQFAQAACRRDITLSIVRDWLEARGHRSVRFLITGQSAWPHYQLLIERILGDFDTCIDPKFDKRLSRRTSFMRELCTWQRGPGIWIDYEVYVRTLFPEATADQASAR